MHLYSICMSSFSVCPQLVLANTALRAAPPKPCLPRGSLRHSRRSPTSSTTKNHIARTTSATATTASSSHNRDQ
ncbi:hypothetical protein BKA80DRAFT_267626 [Phyllosticta citrichinensis]